MEHVLYMLILLPHNFFAQLAKFCNMKLGVDRWNLKPYLAWSIIC